MSGLMFPAPLPPQPWIPHSCPITLATSAVPPIGEDLNQKPALPSQQLPFKLSAGLEGHLIQWIVKMIGSGYR